MGVTSFEHKAYLKHLYSLILKFLGFSALTIAGYIDLKYSDNSIYEDPFVIGAFCMALATLLTIIYPKIYFIHTAMFLFIITKIISQYTHSKHFNIFGIHPH
jgi:hypothetical protein